jgi:hypothetical protein
MMRDHDTIPRGTPQAEQRRFGSIVRQTKGLLIVLCAFFVVGAAIALAGVVTSLRK